MSIPKSFLQQTTFSLQWYSFQYGWYGFNCTTAGFHLRFFDWGNTKGDIYKIAHINIRLKQKNKGRRDMKQGTRRAEPGD